MALTSGGFLGTASPVGPRRTSQSQATTDLQQQAIDAYSPGGRPSTATVTADPSRAYIDAVSGNPNSFGTVGEQRGTPVNSADVQQRAAISDQTRGLQAALQFYQGIYGPQLAQQQAYTDSLAGKAGFAEANFGLQSSILKDQFGIDLARLGLENQGLGIERGAANRQIANADVLQALAYQLLGNTYQGFDIDLAKLGLNEKGLDIDSRDANQRHAAQTRQAMSSAAGRGAMNAPGIKRTQTELAQDLWNTQERIGLSRQDIGLSKEQVGLGKDRARLGYERETVGLKEQRAAARDRLATLDLRGQGLGLDRKSLQNNLDQGLAKLGLDQWITTNDLLDAMNSSDLQQRAIAEQIYRNALERSDFFATLDPAALAQLGLGPKPASGALGGGGLTRTGRN